MTLVQTLLWPLSVIFGLFARLRVRFYRPGIFRRRELKGVVISVGNLTVGGTGKTPMVLWLAEHLLAEGKRVVVLTRGYRGFLKGSGGGKRAAAEAGSLSTGDEPAMLRQRVAARYAQSGNFRVAAGADRVARGRDAERDGFDCFLLDDGFQHLRLARDLNLLLIDASDPFGGGRLLPSGRLREPKSAMHRADIIVITRSTHAPAVEAAVRRFSTAPIFYAVLRLIAIVRAGDTPELLADTEMKSRRFFAYCGIGNPNAFFENLREWGLTVSGTARFPDHHIYSKGDRERLEAEARSLGADALLCTEKDAFNLGAAWTSRLPVFYARVSLEMQNAEAFWNAAREIIELRRPGFSL